VLRFEVPGSPKKHLQLKGFLQFRLFFDQFPCRSALPCCTNRITALLVPRAPDSTETAQHFAVRSGLFWWVRGTMDRAQKITLGEVRIPER